MQRFLNAMKAQASALDQSSAQPRFALVSSFDPATYTARVLLQPEGVLSGWLPVLTAWGGGGWGMVCPPTPGQQVLVVAQEGEAEHGVILGVAFSAASAPPAAPAGEFWLVHQSGACVKLLADGSISCHATTFALAGDVKLTGNLTLSGNLAAGGDIADAAGAHGTLAALRGAHDGHTHVDSRGGTTSPASVTV